MGCHRLLCRVYGWRMAGGDLGLWGPRQGLGGSGKEGSRPVTAGASLPEAAYTLGPKPTLRGQQLRSRGPRNEAGDGEESQGLCQLSCAWVHARGSEGCRARPGGERVCVRWEVWLCEHVEVSVQARCGVARPCMHV